MSLNPLPMGAVPEKLATIAALEELVQPDVGSGWDVIFDLFFAHFEQRPTTFHAAGIAFREAQFGANKGKLFGDSGGGRNPDAPDLSMDDRSPVGEVAIGREDDGAHFCRFGDQFSV